MSNLTRCHVCGADSRDPEWCDNCGSSLTTRPSPQELAWLAVGERILFPEMTPQPDPPPAAAPAGPFEVIGPVSSPEDGTPSSPDLAPPTPNVAGQPFEVIGPVMAEIHDAVGDMADHASPDAAPPDVDSAGATTDPVTRQDEHAPRETCSVKITELQTAYSKRRLWNALDVDNDVSYIVEERQLADGEDITEQSTLAPRAELASKHIFGALRRRPFAQRVLTLIEAPRGETLQQWRQRVGDAGATPQAVFRHLSALFDIIEAVHAREHVHLHLQPETIWITDEGLRFSELDDFTPLPIATSQFRARPGYSAPELFGRSRQDVDTRADIFSLGAIAYYLISGRWPPVSPETTFAPVLPPRDLRPGFPIGWSELVLIAMDPVPAHRFENVGDLHQAFRDGLAMMETRAAFTGAIHIDAAADRHIGLNKQKRSPINQDHVFLAHNPDRDWLLAVVADGVSTATFGSGDLASGYVTTRAKEVWLELQHRDTDPDPKVVLSDIIGRANQDVVDYVNREHGPLHAPPSEVMGSTVLVAFVHKGRFTLASLGDSRCYVVRNDLMECVTRDHNLFTLSLIDGLGLEEVMMMPHGDALARCLGTFEVDAEGVLTAQEPLLDFYELSLIPGDHVLLCTDGLFDYAGPTCEESEDNIRRTVLGESHPGLACLELILLANRGGGGDNIGVVLLNVDAADVTADLNVVQSG